MTAQTYNGIWRKPHAEGVDLYPGLTVHDGRVSGSITAGQTRLPLWCFAYTAIVDGWSQVEGSWHPSKYGWDAARFGTFLSDLLEPRGEFGRLLCVLADAERRDRAATLEWMHQAAEPRRKKRVDPLPDDMAGWNRRAFGNAFEDDPL